MNEVAFVHSNLAPVEESPSLATMQPLAGVLISEYRFHGCGIYGIENAKTRVVYVGQTKDFWVRIRTELVDLRAGEHHCKHLQRSFNKHGESFFRLHVLELCEEKELNARELHWIHEKKTTVGVYNSKTSSDCGRFWTTTQDAADLQSKNKKELWALPLFAHYQQKKMWSDDRKSAVRDNYIKRTLQILSAAGFVLDSKDSAKTYVETRLSNGASFKKLMTEFGFYKKQWQVFCRNFDIDKFGARKVFRDKLFSAKRGELRSICSVENYSISAAYMFLHKSKKPAPISESGLNDSGMLTL
jgi:group I intron endonuclease